MPTTYTDQFYLIDPGNPPPAGTVLNFSVLSLIDNDNDGDIGPDGNDSVDGRDVRQVYENDTITVQRPDGSVTTITGTTFYTRGGGRYFTPNDGSVLEGPVIFLSSTWVSNSTFMPVGDLGPACFVRGTRIATPDGLRRVEDLSEGDLVLTRDAGPQPVLWISHREAEGSGDHAPIRLAKGALGNTADLLVSPQHRMLIDGWRAELFYGQDEVLVAAKHLVGGHEGILVAPRDSVEYFHLLMDGHHLIWAEGCLSESLDPGGDFALRDPRVRAELDARFPDLIGERGPCTMTARPVVRGYEAQVLAA